MKTRLAEASVALLAITAGALAQTLTFEVASVKPAPPIGQRAFRGAKIEGNKLEFGAASLWQLLPYSFHAKEYQIVAPDWTRDSQWTIQANLPEGSTREQAADMMRALLVDRFKLTTHIERREQSVYQLVVAAGGPKVELNTGGEFKTWDGSFPGFGFGGLLRGDTVITGRIMEQPNCGQRWEFVPLPMSSFVDALTMFLDKPVVDETKLKGDYKVYLDIDADTMTAMNQNMMRGQRLPGGGGGDGGRGGGKQGPGGPAAAAPTPARTLGQCLEAARESGGSLGMLFKAVQKLGLDLKQTRAPVDTIIVDRLEKAPTEN